jgi:hypothetical protein
LEGRLEDLRSRGLLDDEDVAEVLAKAKVWAEPQASEDANTGSLEDPPAERSPDRPAVPAQHG